MSTVWSLASMRFRNADDAIDCTRFLMAVSTLVDAAFYRWLKRANLTRTHISVLHLRYDESPEASRVQWSLHKTLGKKYSRHKRFRRFLDDMVDEGNSVIDMIDSDAGSPQWEQVFRQSVTLLIKQLQDLAERVKLHK